MSSYEFVVIDPRPQKREHALALIASRPTLGVEMTLPDLAAACTLGNLDPQHTGGDPARAAVEAALEWPLPPAGTLLATVRADADAFAAMALLTLREEGAGLAAPLRARVNEIAAADKRVPRTAARGQAVSDFHAMAALVADFQVPAEERVAAVKAWLTDGALPRAPRYRERVAADRPTPEQLDSARAAVELVADGKVALLQSQLRAGAAIAYERAPVAIIWNPAFSIAGSEPHLKYTICQAEPGRVDLRGVWDQLTALEANGAWGGSPMVGGSPQGTAPSIGHDEIVAVVIRHLA